MKTSSSWSASLWSIVVTSLLVGSHGSQAAEPEQPTVASAATRAHVHEALQREMYGLGDEREKLLTAASEAEPTAPLPRWYLGEVKTADGSWRPAGKSSAAEEQLHREYTAFRVTKGDDSSAHRTLADWCERKGLQQQERAHLMRSLVLNPNQTELRTRLGLIRVGQSWVEKSAVARQQRRQQEIREAFDRWNPLATRLALQLTAADPAKRAEAKTAILAINDVGALYALQAALVPREEEHHQILLEWCGRFGDVSATESIAWIAADCPTEKLRAQAAEMLKQREPVDFAPQMIAQMYTPVTSRIETVRSADGTLSLRRSYWREGADRHELFVSDDRILGPFTRLNAAPGTFTLEERLQSAVGLAASRSEIAVSEQNRLTKARNERIAAALVIATGEELDAKPEEWWQWWMDLNEWTMPDGKGLVTYYQQRNLDTVENVLPRLTSCLSAGTPVWTDQGPVAVERIRVGDLVLSRDVETGELAYKPVLFTTVRPQRQLTQLTVGRDKFHCTGGHLFWVSGSGWVRAKELQPSQVLHTAANPAHVGEVHPGIVAETYNLVVADFHTYFVGDNKLLSHDNSPRRPTRMIVPGLAAE